jgi:uncharacterized protein (TIGR03382 family)
MKKALLACAALTVPFAARAQNFILTSPQAVTIGTAAPQIFVGKAACPTLQLNFRWDMTAESEPTTGQIINIVHARSAGTCGSTTVTAPDTLAQAQSQTSTGQDSVGASSMILDADAGLPGGCDNTTTSSASPWSTFYCIQLSSNTTVSTTPVYEDVQINYAMAPPTAPGQLSVEQGDKHLKVYWQIGNSAENISNYDVHVLAPGDTLDLTKRAANTSALNADVEQTDDGAALVNDTTYTLQVVANDVYGNVSGPSDPASGTPVEIYDFYELYRLQGGRATGGGGCSSAGAGTWIAVLALAVGFIARRRKRARNGAALVVFFALFAPRAEAQQADRPTRFLLVGLKIDRYDPKVDTEAGLTGQPYHEIFGTRAPLRYQLEVDWEAWHPYGTLMIGGTIGFWENYGHGLIAATLQPSQDTALLDVMPIGIVATYRFDKLADMWPRWPIIPYAQLGLMRALWASFNGTHDVSTTTDGGRGSGWTWGYTTALGVALALDSIDPDLSREAWLNSGVQRSSFFAEYGWTKLDDFGGSNALILSDHAWRFGISIEF